MKEPFFLKLQKLDCKGGEWEWQKSRRMDKAKDVNYALTQT